jgi:SAM-dependent methyltransferase
MSCAPSIWWSGYSKIGRRKRLFTLQMMALHPLAERFAGVAGAYERGRPEYAPAVVGAIAAELRIPPGGRVLDLAAGTGKLTRALLNAGLDVVAIEPQRPLREVLAASVGGERVREGLAEAIPLADGSVDAVTVADAFHWFDQAVALREIGRVLRPGGGLAVLSTVPDWGSASWAHEVGTLITSLRPEHPHFDGPPWQDAVRAAGGWTASREIRVTTPQPASPERMVDHIASMSWVAALPDDQRAETLAQIRAIVDAGETPAELPVHVVIGLAALA